MVAVEKPALLIPAQRQVGRVQVEHDLVRRFGVRLEKDLQQQCIGRFLAAPNLFWSGSALCRAAPDG